MFQTAYIRHILAKYQMLLFSFSRFQTLAWFCIIKSKSHFFHLSTVEHVRLWMFSSWWPCLLETFLSRFNGGGTLTFTSGFLPQEKAWYTLLCPVDSFAISSPYVLVENREITLLGPTWSLYLKFGTAADHEYSMTENENDRKRVRKRYKNKTRLGFAS